MTALTCPFCNTAFDVPSIPGRVVCPRCGEAIPAKLLPAPTGPAMFTAVRPGPVEPMPASKSPRPVMLAAIGLMLASILGLGIWYYTRTDNADNPNNALKTPPPTRPPLGLPGMVHLHPDTQIVVALQPSPLIQYSERTGQSPEAVLASLGFQTGIFGGLRNAGIPFERIDHFIVGVSFGDSPLPRLSMILFLREPIESERQFREAVKLRQNADIKGRAKVELPSMPLPMEMHKLSDTTYLFSSDEATLEGMIKASESARMSAGLRASIQKVDLASFGWIATDDRDWAALPTLKLAAPLIGQPELPKRLRGIRAFAAGLTLRPDLSAVVNVRFADATAARELTTRAQPLLGDNVSYYSPDPEWAGIWMQGSSLQQALPALGKVFDR